MSLIAAGEDGLLFEPYGFPHKRVGYTILPPFCQTEAIAALKESWTPPEGSIFVALPSGSFLGVSAALSLLVALAEQWSPDRIQKDASDQLPSSVDLKRTFNLPGHGGATPPSFGLQHRIVELRASKGTLILDGTASSSNECFITRLPPSLLPALALGQSLLNEHRRQDLDIKYKIGDENIDTQSPCKIVALCADPRYLIMREYLSVVQIQKWTATSQESLGAAQYFKIALENDLMSGLRSVAEWARAERIRPLSVRTFFIEDLLLDPDAALCSIADFLGLRDGHDTLDKVTESFAGLVRQCKGLFASIPGGMSEIDYMRNLIQQFESYRADMPLDTAARLAKQASPLLQYRIQRIQSILEPTPPWRAAHEAGTCKPCSFAARGICRNGTACNFCHGPHAAVWTFRPSKKERDRKDRQRAAIRIRTPSPGGLSS